MGRYTQLSGMKTPNPNKCPSDCQFSQFNPAYFPGWPQNGSAGTPCDTLLHAHTHTEIQMHTYRDTDAHIQMHTYRDTDAHIQMHTYRDRDAHVQMHTYRCTRTDAHVQMHTYRCTRTDAHVQMHTYRCTRTDAHVQMHTYRYTRTDAHIQIYMHRYMCMHITCCSSSFYIRFRKKESPIRRYI